MTNMKFLFLGLALSVLSNVHADEAVGNTCMEFIKSSNINMCCENHGNKIITRCDNIDMDSEDGKCKFFECYLQERGLMRDGKITKGNLQRILERVNNDNETNRVDLITYYGGISMCKELDNDPMCMAMVNETKACISAIE